MKYYDIPGFEGLYQLSRKGDRIMSHDRKVLMPNGGFKIETAHCMRLDITKKGYVKVMLTNSKGIRKGYFVHRLVMRTFKGYSNLQVNHLDEDKQNNRLNNLEYITNKGNQIYSLDKSKTSSKYIGVTFIKKSGTWQAQKFVNGKNTYIGSFSKEKDAKKAYDNYN